MARSREPREPRDRLAEVIVERAPERRIGSGWQELAEQVRVRLEGRIAKPPRAANDWSIAPPEGCSCPLCEALTTFLADPIAQSLEWPLKAEHRQHIHSRIELNELPVQHRTRRTGRPYTLVLTKLAELFDREERARHEHEEALRWLRAAASGPTARPHSRD